MEDTHEMIENLNIPETHPDPAEDIFLSLRPKPTIRIRISPKALNPESAKTSTSQSRNHYVLPFPPP